MNIITYLRSFGYNLLTVNGSSKLKRVLLLRLASILWVNNVLFLQKYSKNAIYTGLITIFYNEHVVCLCII